MQPHPNSIGLNIVDLFPEIFETIEFKRFFLPGHRMDDFIGCSSFLFGSKANEDISMLFSAVQKLEGFKHVDFSAYLQDQSICQRLLNISDLKTLKRELVEIKDRYINSTACPDLSSIFIKKIFIILRSKK